MGAWAARSEQSKSAFDSSITSQCQRSARSSGPSPASPNLSDSISEAGSSAVADDRCPCGGEARAGDPDTDGCDREKPEPEAGTGGTGVFHAGRQFYPPLVLTA